MKICSIVAEYNPFHNGHLSQINYIKEVLKPDYIAVFLSGNFTQRGEGAVLDKYTRARHAVLSGADVVFELPTVFATQSAELFASGAVKLINSLPLEKSICFGSECGDKNKIIKTATYLLDENTKFKEVLKKELKSGSSLLQAREVAVKEAHPDFDREVLALPNNVLGIEYVKAIIKNNCDIDIEVIKRNGADYNSTNLDKNAPSSFGVRKAVESGKITRVKNLVPSYVFEDLSKANSEELFDKIIMYALTSATKKDIAKTVDCAEGLENRIKALIKNNFTIPELLEKLKTKRYTTKRLKRILLSTTLKIDKKLVHTALKKDLYLKVLAINGQKTELLSELSNAKYPLITRKSDVNKLSSTALEVFEKDVFSGDVYSLATGKKINEFNMLII